MKRLAHVVMLKDDPEIIRKYEEYHANVWPEVQHGCLERGVCRSYIYRYGRLLFMFKEVADDYNPERDMPRYLSDPKVREWEDMMRSFQEPIPGAPEGETWVEMNEVYALEPEEGPLARSLQLL